MPTLPAWASPQVKVDLRENCSGKSINESIPVDPHLAPSQVLLTEEETEYSVVAVKYVFDAAVALQFTCSNTVAEQILENVTVAVDLADAVRAEPLRRPPLLLLLCLLGPPSVLGNSTSAWLLIGASPLG